MKGWINVDISPYHETDFCGDILQMTFEDNYFDVILATHFFEHLAYPNDAVKCLGLFYKWLKPSGILRLAVPSLELATRAYCGNKDLRFLYGNDFKAYYYKDCAAERLNFFIKAWEHQMCYDYDLLYMLLAEHGFRCVDSKRANESNIPNFNHDRFISESLYVEAIK